MNKKPGELIIFMDNAGRKIIAEFVSLEGQNLTVVNPAVLFEAEGTQGQLVSNIVPVYFPDYCEDVTPNERVRVSWIYNINNLAISWDGKLNKRFAEIYNRIFVYSPPSQQKTPNPPQTPNPETSNPENVVKLFDE